MTSQSLPTAAAQIAAGGHARRRGRALLCVSGTSFLIMLDSNIVAVSLPSIARDLHAAFGDIEWVVTAYVLAFAALLLPAGALADRLGRRRMLASGLGLFTVASLLCGLAPGAAILNWARALQGAGAALQLSAALAILGHEFRGPDRARAFAFWGTVVGVAVAAGPVVGGLITSAFGWRWAFLVNVPVGIALVLLTLESIDESRDPHARRLDLPGIALFGAGLFCVVWGLIGGNVDGWGSAATGAKLGAGVVLLGLFVVAERLQERPMVDLAVFRRPTFLGAACGMFGYAAAAQVMMTLLPLYLQNAYGLAPARAGLAMLPFALPLFVCPRLGGVLSRRMSGRAILAIGLGVVALGNLATAAAIAAALPYAVLALAMLVTGCGTGLLNGETTKVQLGAVPPERAGMASGLTGMTRFVGIVVGIAGLGAVLAGVTEAHLRATLAGSAASSAVTDLHGLSQRIVAGDAAGALSHTAQPARDILLALARDGFAAGFVGLLLAAAVVAAIAALLVLRLVSARETAPASST